MWELTQEVFELRFSNEFLYWDKTGHIGKRLLSLLPTLTLENATPGQTIFVDTENQTRVLYSHSSVNLMQVVSNSPAVKLFDSADSILTMMIAEMEVKTISRVGHRTQYVEKFSSEEKSHVFVTEIATKRKLGGDLFAETGEDWLKARRLSEVRAVFSDQKVGIGVALNTGVSDYSISGPHTAFIRQHLPPTEYVAMLDIDIFTRQPMSVENLNSSAFRESNSNLIKKNILPLFVL